MPVKYQLKVCQIFEFFIKLSSRTMRIPNWNDMKVIFDKSVLENLRTIEKKSGQNIVSELIAEFVIDADMSVKNIREYLDSAKFAELAKVAHSLKSSSANVGAIGLSNIYEKIEYLIVSEKSNNAEILNQLVEEAENVMKLTLQFLQSS